MVTGTKIAAVLSLVGNTTYGQHRVCVPGVHAPPVHQRILCYQYGCNIAKLEWYLESLHISQSQAELLPTVALVQHGKSFNKPEKQWVRAVAAAGAAKALQSCLTLCDPHRRQPTRPLCPWDSLGENTGVSCHCLLQCMRVKTESEVTPSCPTLRDPMDCSLPGSSIHGNFQARVVEWGAIR